MVDIFEAIMGWVLIAAILGEIVVAILALFRWGGVKRHATALLAVGFCYLIIGCFFGAAFYTASYAIQDDAYFGNIILGSLFIFIGCLVVSASLAGLGLRWWGSVPYGLASLIAANFAWSKAVYGTSWWGTTPSNPDGFGTASIYGGAPLLIFLGVYIAITAVLVLVLKRWQALGISLITGGVGAAIVLIIYGFGRMDIAVWGVVGTAANRHKPPYVYISETVASTIAFLVVFLVARWLSRSAPATPTIANHPPV